MKIKHYIIVLGHGCLQVQRNYLCAYRVHLNSRKWLLLQTPAVIINVCRQSAKDEIRANIYFMTGEQTKSTDCCMDDMRACKLLLQQIQESHYIINLSTSVHY